MSGQRVAPEAIEAAETKLPRGDGPASSIAEFTTIYVDGVKLTPEEAAVHKVPRLMQGSTWFCSMCWCCCFLSCLLPIAGVVVASQVVAPLGESLVVTILYAVSASLAALGCLFFSFYARAVVTTGALCKPKAPTFDGPWVLGDAGQGGGIEAAIKKVKVVVNPNAGVKKGQSNLDICKRIWAKYGIEVVVVNTTHSRHALEIGSTEDLTGVDAMCIIGGDGSIHELTNGLMLRKDELQVPMGVLPGGSGNSLMCDLGTWDMEEAAERVARGCVFQMDLIEIQAMGKSMYSMNESTFGLIGDVGIVAEELRCLGPARYNAVGAWSILKNYACHIRLDLVLASGEKKTVDGDFVTLAVMHTQHLGQGLRISPSGKLDDGLMEVVMVRSGRMNRGEGLAVLNQLPDGSHENNKDFEMYKATQCTVTLDEPGVFNVDGEIVKHRGTVGFRVHPKKLSVIATASTSPGNRPSKTSSARKSPGVKVRRKSIMT